MLAPGSEHRVAEGGIGPCVDHARTLDPCRMRFGLDLGDFGENRPLRAILLAGRDNDRHVEDFAILASAIDCFAASSRSMFLISCIVPTWWSISSNVALSAVNRSWVMVVVLCVGFQRNGSGGPLK